MLRGIGARRFCVHVNRVTLPDFPFQNVDAQRIENLSWTGAPRRSHAVDVIVTCAGEKCPYGIGQLERDLLSFERKSEAIQL